MKFVPTAPHDLDRKADAVFVRAAPFVFAMVRVRGDEFVDQIAFGAHDLDAVVARVLRERRAAREIVDRRVDLARGQRMRGERIDRRLQRARRDERRMIGVAAEVQDLHRDPAAGVVHRARDDPMALGLLLGREHRAAGHHPAALVRRDAARDDEPGLAARALGVERGHPLEAVCRLLEPDMHRAHQHAVLQRSETELQRSRQVGIEGHRALFFMQRVAQIWRRPSSNATRCIKCAL